MNERTPPQAPDGKRPDPLGPHSAHPGYRIPQCLTIAGSDSGGGAGVQADLKAMQANGVFGLSVLTSITAQNTKEVVTAEDLPVEIIRAQLRAVFCDFEIGAIKTGMLSSADIVVAVSEFLEDQEALPPLVVDPVMISKSGYSLLRDEAIAAVKERLLPLAKVVTPNRHEAELLSSVSISGPESLAEAAARILELGTESVLIKGGHLEEVEATDYLFRRGSSSDAPELVARFSSPRWATRATHGTGCTFSAAIAARLALGHELDFAIREAKEYVSSAIRYGLGIGHGHGPTDHFYFLRSWYRETEGTDV
ncbi:MAG: bifunctional hydroxymethylpyrimidine kinase/phosphomethylpyrimidine kinase [Candidatus Eisenbacteria bacterium]